MNNKMIVWIVIIVVVLGVIAAGAYYWQQPAAPEAMLNDDATIKDDDAMEDKNDDVTIEDKDDTMVKDKINFSGTILAGSSAPLVDFNQADYQKALDSGKTVFLYFYANWCPVCKVEEPVLRAAFDALDRGDLIGFRVNYRDSDTDSAEEDLARQFGVAYQHTKVAVKDGQVVLKAPDSWDAARYEEELGKL